MKVFIFSGKKWKQSQQIMQEELPIVLEWSMSGETHSCSSTI